MQEEKFGIATKTYMLKEIMGKLESSPNFVITNYSGVSSPDIENLRRDLRKSSSRYLVVKNSIVKKAFDQLKVKDVTQFIKGEVGIGLIGDIVAASKTFADFSKTHDSFKLNCAVIEGRIETSDRIKYLATLPSREVLLAFAINYMRSPVTGFVGLLKGLLRNLVYAISEIKKGKEGGKKNG